MIKLTNTNPYEVLDIPLNANKGAITRAYTEKNRGDNQERALARQAYDALRKPEDRLLVDAFTPSFFSDPQHELLVTGIQEKIGEKVDWLSYLDEKQVLEQDLKALIEVIIRHIIKAFDSSSEELELDDKHDGLEEFLFQWLK